ncbi:hypothetical protein EDB80DRAFT_563333 [Ilyonectria destructans]|nr:hypothetical protein EDB80DRAFT_563333 [Ilyonectria destructans]
MSSRQSDERSTSTAAKPTIRFVTKTAVETATATITKTTTATATTTPAGGSTGLSTAAITGIAVASVVAAFALILLCFTVTFFRRKRRHLHLAPPAPVAETCPDASSELSPEALGATTGFAGLPNLLMGASDSEVEGELASLGLLIDHHVRCHYHRDNILVTPDTLHASLRQLQLTEVTCDMVARLSINPNTRYVAIRHLLALVIFSNLDTHSIGLLSLLPPTLKELSRSRPEASKEKRDSLVETALVSWNQITAFLMHKNPHAQTPLRPPPSVESQVKALVTPLQEFLVHFVRIDNHHPLAHQQAGLAGIIRACVKFGYEVFSHPCDWEFTFPQQEKGIIVVPGLEQHSGDMGELYDSPKILLAPEVVTVDPTKTNHYPHSGQVN